MLAQTGVEPIQKAVYTLYQMSEDEKIQEMAHQREISLHDEATRMGSARREGRADVVREMLKDNMPIPQIAKYSGLTLKEIESLQLQ